MVTPGRLRPGYKNIDELSMQHMVDGVWEHSEGVAKRLERDKYEKLDHWRVLEKVTLLGKKDVRGWSNLADFLQKCSDDLFREFFRVLSSNRQRISLDFFLKLTQNSKASGEELYIFLMNCSAYTPSLVRDGVNDNPKRFDIITKLIDRDRNVDLSLLNRYLDYDFKSRKSVRIRFLTLQDIENRATRIFGT